MTYLRSVILLIPVLFASACSSLPAQVDSALNNPEQAGTRWGIFVVDTKGEQVYARRAEERFIPASNTKIVSSMAGYHLADALAEHASPGTKLFMISDPSGASHPDLVLVGGGDAGLGDGPDCTETCLSQLADSVVSAGIVKVNKVIGDDTLFPDERWGPGWSQEDLQFYYGTAVSALSVNDNILYLNIEPGDEIGARAKVEWQLGDDLYTLKNELITVVPTKDRNNAISVERPLASAEVRVFGEILWNSGPRTFRIGVHDPARLAAERLKRLLEIRGVEVLGEVDVRHRPSQIWDRPEAERDAEWVDITPGAEATSDVLVAALPNSALSDTQAEISKNSNNLHSELLLRRLGLIAGTGSRAQGLAILESMLEAANVGEGAITLADGTGMSVYNRVTPAGLVQLLQWARTQDWGDQWRADQPIAGVDGSLARRFRGTPLERKLFAKTGTLNGVNALSGYMIAQSGRELTFSIIANDRPPMTDSALVEMQDALLAIAANH